MFLKQGSNLYASRSLLREMPKHDSTKPRDVSVARLITLVQPSNPEHNTDVERRVLSPHRPTAIGEGATAHRTRGPTADQPTRCRPYHTSVDFGGV